MGTIEHFAETEAAIREMARVLKPGGRAIIGVPNRHDPFLRPAFAAALQALGLYAYGLEKSYSRRALRDMIERAGLTVTAETAILFMPGWLRIIDLVCHAWCPPLTVLTGACVWPFVALDRYVPAVRRHGYLLATVATKR
jgi:SAM-dependent methyltransferase